jgi:hypothetical protein
MHIDGLYDNVDTAMLEKRVKALEKTQGRQWVELTDTEVDTVWQELKDAGTLSHKTFARAIQAKSKQKNAC